MPANPPIGLQRFIPSSEPQRAMVQSLMRQVRTLETAGRGGLEGRRISSGFEVIDRCLPQGGYLSGSLVEWLYEGAGNGGWWFALQAAKQAMEGGKYLVVLDPQRRFYPVAVASLGIPLDRMIVIQAKDEADLLWSLDQSLRNSSVGAVVASIEQFDDREARRLQLAAEQGGGLGLLLRPARRARGMPSWAEVQWHLQPRSSIESKNANQRRFDLQLLRCRGGRTGARLSLIFDGDHGGLARVEDRLSPTEGIRHASQGALCLAAELAMPAHAAKRSSAGRAPVRVASA